MWENSYAKFQSHADYRDMYVPNEKKLQFIFKKIANKIGIKNIGMLH